MKKTKKKDPHFWKRAALGIALFISIPLFGFWFYTHRHFVSTSDAYLNGYQVNISPDINARIVALYGNEGDSVKKGDLLCSLDESIYRSQKEDCLTNIQLLEREIELKTLQMEKMNDIFTVARNEHERQIISRIEFDKIEKDYFLSDIERTVAIAKYTNGLAKLGIIEELLQHTKVYAPRDGSLAKRWVVAGDAVQFGQPLFSLTDTSDIWVTANFEETKVQKIKPGNPVRIRVDAYPGREFTGSVFSVMASAASRFSLIPPNNATGNFTKVVQRVPVKILLETSPSQDPLYLYPGMSVEVDIQIK